MAESLSEDRVLTAINKLKPALAELAKNSQKNDNPDYESFKESVQGMKVKKVDGKPNTYHIIFEQGDTKSDFQPEACRLAYSALEIAFRMAGIKEVTDPEKRHDLLGKTRYLPDKKGKPTDRHITIRVPDDGKESLIQSLEAVTTKINSHHDSLKYEYDELLKLALSGFNKLTPPQAKPHPMIEHNNGPLNVLLHVQNVPTPLADELSEITGIHYKPCCKKTDSRDGTTEYPADGKNVTIRIDRKIGKVARAVMEYVQKQKSQSQGNTLGPDDIRTQEPVIGR